jgi:hypothetical protein
LNDKTEVMKTKNTYRLLMLLLLAVFAGGCKDENSEPLDFYEMAYEVPLHGTRYIGIRSGSGDYSVQVGNPGLFQASKEEGWSNPAGMISVRGLLTGESTLIVTDNHNGERASLTIKVTDNYEVLRIFQLYRDDSTIAENKHPVLSKMPFVFLVNNKSRDLYFADRSGNESITESGVRIKGKGSYSFTMEDNKLYLNLIYASNEKGELTNDAAFAPTSHKFQITEHSEFLLHRLNKNLNLSFETPVKNYPADQSSLVLKMKSVDSDD